MVVSPTKGCRVLPNITGCGMGVLIGAISLHTSSPASLKTTANQADQIHSNWFPSQVIYTSALGVGYTRTAVHKKASLPISYLQLPSQKSSNNANHKRD